ncbi:MAG: SDR family NAD(P)-dependent oxidoreductase [Candidatus Acidiferrales bacterium]
MTRALENQYALVTGASSGIGRAFAMALAEQGACVAMVARRREILEAIVAEASAKKYDMRAFPADLMREGEIRALRERVERELGAVDILVHSAGHIYHGRLEASPAADLESQFIANVRGPYLLTQELLPFLRKRPGQIVFINSSAGLKASAGAGQFSATQHALKAIAESLRDEVNAEGIRVLNIFPGRTATPRQKEIYREEGRVYQPEVLLQPESIAAMAVAALSLPRTAEVTEIRIRPMQKSY